MKKIFLLVLFSQHLVGVAQSVGIGTTNPYRARFEVQGGHRTNAIFGGESTGMAIHKGTPGLGFNHYLTSVDNYIANGYAATQYVSQTTGHMAIDLFGSGTANNACTPPLRALTLTQSGTAWIGLPSYNASLSVARLPGVEATAFFFGSSHNSAFNFGAAEHTYIRAGRNNGTVYINDIAGGKVVLSGPVGVNTSYAEYPLEVMQANSRGLMLEEPYTFKNWEFVVSSVTGNLHLQYDRFPRGQYNASSGAYSSISDSRLKTNVQALSPVLDKVLALEPVEYEMTYGNPGHERTIGFIAQDVKQVFPEIVGQSNNASPTDSTLNNLHAINYSAFGAISVKAVQEQQQLIDAQSKRIQALQAKLEALHKKIKQ
jgi:hypothetical protein